MIRCVEQMACQDGLQEIPRESSGEAWITGKFLEDRGVERKLARQKLPRGNRWAARIVRRCD